MPWASFARQQRPICMHSESRALIDFEPCLLSDEVAERRTPAAIGVGNLARPPVLPVA